MATILEFRQEHRSSSASNNGLGRPAEIVFFPGVRYERAEETTQPSKRRQRRRDQLEIEGSDH